MENGIDIDELIEYFVGIYRNVETRLILKIAESFKQYEEINLGNSMAWYLRKLEELGGLNNDAIEIISEYSNIPKKDVIKVLKRAGYDIDFETIKLANASGKYNIDIDKLLNSKKVNEIIENSYKEINNTFRLIKTKAQEGFNDAYMNVLNESYTSIATGVVDYNTAISNALKDLVKSGITVTSYKQKNGTIRNYSIESTVRRDSLTAVVQMQIRSELERAKEIGADCVEVSEHIDARVTDTFDYRDHSWWQGKVYKLEGSNSKYPNFQETCNFGDVQGIGGANCRHKIFSFFSDIDIPKGKNIDREENKKAYELSQQQRMYERKIRGYKKNIEVGKVTNDERKIKTYNDKFKELNKEYSDFCTKNNLKRHYERERIIEQYSKTNSARNLETLGKTSITRNLNNAIDDELKQDLFLNTNDYLNKYGNVIPEKEIIWKLGNLPTRNEEMVLANEKFYINKNIIGDKNRFVKIIEHNQKIGNLVKTDNPIKQIVGHEVGHRIQIGLFRKLYNKPFANRSESDAWVESFMSNVVDEYYIRFPGESLLIDEALSKYGASDYFEMFSEAFSEYTCSLNPRPFATTFGIMLEKELEKVI